MRNECPCALTLVIRLPGLSLDENLSPLLDTIDNRSYHMKAAPDSSAPPPSEESYAWRDLDATKLGFKLSLAAACRRCDVNAVKSAAMLGIDFNEVCDLENEFCPIHIAVDEGCIPLVQWLVIEGKVDLTILSKAGETPLHIACRKSHIEIVQWLLLKGADPLLKNYDGDTCYHVIVSAGNVQLLKGCLDINVSIDPYAVNSKKQTVLAAACAVGSVESILLLLDTGAVVNALDAEFKSPLHWACTKCIAGGVKALLDHGAVLNMKDSSGCTPLHLACSAGNLDVVKYLLTIKHNQIHAVTNAGDTCLHLACSTDNYELVRLLVEDGHQDVEGVNVHDHTPLDKACASGCIDVAKYLVHRGAEVNRCNVISGRTAMHSACNYGQLRMAIWLYKKGGEVDIPDKSGYTPFLCAAFFGHLRVMQWLYDTEEVDVHRTGGSTDPLNTALHLACEQSHVEVAAWLLSIGLDLRKPNTSGISPADIAESNGFLDKLVTNSQSNGDEFGEVNGHVYYADEEEAAVLESIGALESCLQRDDFEVARTILETFDATAAVHRQFPHGKTLAHYAAASGHLEYLRYLIMQGYDVDATTAVGRTPLFYASAKGHLEVAKLLFEHGADPAAKDILGYSSVSMALKHRQGSIVHWFSTFVKDILNQEHDFPTEEGKRGRRGLSPTQAQGLSNVTPPASWKGSSLFACFSEGGEFNSVNFSERALSQSFSLPPPSSILSEIQEAQRQTVMQQCTPQQSERDIHCDADEEAELLDACLRGDLLRVRYLVETGIRLDCKSGDGAYTPLHLACMSGNLNLVQYLLRKGVALQGTDTRGATPLHICCDHKYTDLTLHLIKLGADLSVADSKGEAALHVACRRGMTELFKDLVDLPRSVLPNLDLSLVDSSGCNLLHIASHAANVQLVTFLLSLDCFDIDAGDLKGRTALHHACMSNAQEVVVFLVKNNAAVDMHDASGKTPFHFACVSGNVNLARWMVEHGSAIFKTTFQANSALHMACALGDLEMVQWLLANGLKGDVPNCKGLTPVLLAYHSGHSDVVNYVVNHIKVRRPTGAMRKDLANIDLFE